VRSAYRPSSCRWWRSIPIEYAFPRRSELRVYLVKAGAEHVQARTRTGDAEDREVGALPVRPRAASLRASRSGGARAPTSSARPRKGQCNSATVQEAPVSWSSSSVSRALTSSGSLVAVKRPSGVRGQGSGARSQVQLDTVAVGIVERQRLVEPVVVDPAQVDAVLLQAAQRTCQRGSRR
jgi:hypothetical protein